MEAEKVSGRPAVDGEVGLVGLAVLGRAHELHDSPLLALPALIYFSLSVVSCCSRLYSGNSHLNITNINILENNNIDQVGIISNSVIVILL